MNPSFVQSDPDELAAALGEHAPLLGLDLGTKTIGLAIGDLGLGLASPLQTLRRTKFTQDAERLRAVMAERGVAALILGLPLNMDGGKGPRAQSTEAFARNLAPLIDVPIAFWDERLSTAAADDRLAALGVSARRRAAAIDSHAAAVILQEALDHMRRRRARLAEA